QALVEFGPFFHAAFMYIMREVVDQAQSGACMMAVGLCGIGVYRFKIDVVDTDVANAAMPILTLPAVNEINQRIADTLDGGNIQLHGAAARVKSPGAQLEGPLVCFAR